LVLHVFNVESCAATGDRINARIRTRNVSSSTVSRTLMVAARQEPCNKKAFIIATATLFGERHDRAIASNDLIAAVQRR
jgi:hypothetical protein